VSASLGRIILISVLFHGATVGVVRADPPTAEEIAAAIRQLGDDRFAVRQKASAFLWAAGKAAEPALLDALHESPLEVVRRAQSILEKFKWGIFPDTPKEVLALIEQYRASEREQKWVVLKQLFQKGPKGLEVVARLINATDNAETRQRLAVALEPEIVRAVPALVLEEQFDTLEQLLEVGLVCSGSVESDMSQRNYAAFLFLRGRLDEKITYFRKRAERPGGERTANLLTYLYRAKGDAVNLRWAAEKSGQPKLLRLVLHELGAWSELAAMCEKLPETEVIPGYRAAYYRLAGRAADMEKSLRGIRREAEALPEGDGSIWWYAKPLFFNGRPQEAIALLLRGHNFHMAFDILCAQLKYQEAFELANKNRDKKEHFYALEGRRAAVLLELGEKEEAKRIVAKLVPKLNEANEGYEFQGVVEAEQRLGMHEQALTHLAFLLERRKKNSSAMLWKALRILFPRHEHEVDYWWLLLRDRRPREEAVVTLRRLREFLDGKLSREELTTLVREAQLVVSAGATDWLYQLGEFAKTCEALGRDDLALECLETWTRGRSELDAWTHLGEFLGKRKQWHKAADCFKRASEFEPDRPDLWYLRGRALVQTGKEKEGKRLMEAARWVPLGNGAKRYWLAKTLKKLGEERASYREWELIWKTGNDDDFYVRYSLHYSCYDEADRKEYLRAAAFEERGRFGIMQHGTFYMNDNTAYMTGPHHFHRWRVRGLLAAGRIDEALAEIRTCLTFLPGDIHLPIRVVPELVKRGRKMEADDLFQKVLAVYEPLCAAYPRSTLFHDRLARLSAGCRRQLDKALTHACKAVELAPKHARYLDTLAEVHFQRGNAAEALRWNARCIELEPHNQFFQKQKQRFESGDPAVPLPE
jgi:predicted Zn-dependent protease